MLARFQCIFSSRHRSMSSPAVATAGNRGLNSLIDTHCHVHVPDDGSATAIAAAAVPARKAAEHANLCCSLDDLRRTSTQDLKLAQVALSNEKGEPPPPHQPKRVIRITMGIREQDWASAVSFGADDLRSKNLFYLQSQETSRPQTSADAATLSGNEAEKTGRAGFDTTPFFQFGLGLHPWYAHSTSENWLRQLTALLEKHPRAMVGEIGLDKVARTPDTRRVEWDNQLEVFQSQMALASALSRPVSVHCVKAYGKLVELLREGEKDTAFPDVDTAAIQGLGCPRGVRLPPRIALHSFTGSVEVTKDILRLGPGCRGEVFFGFSAAVNMRGDREGKRLVEVLRVIPDSQVLIETDRRTPALGSAEELLRVCGAISEAKGVSVEEAGTLANRNALRFLAEIAMPGRKDV